MERLTGKDLRHLSEFLRELYQLRSHDEFTTHLVTTLPSITEGEFTSYNEIHPEAGTSAFKTDLTPFFRDPAHYADVLTRHAKTHPILVHMQQTKDGQPVMMSDFLSMRQFRETDLYNEFYRPLQIPHIIGFALAIDNHRSVTIARHRDGREFSEKTRTTLNAIRPHVLQGFRNALAITHMQDQLAGLNQAMEDARQALLAVTTEGRVKWATPSAYARMRKYGFRVRNGSDWLPSRLREWMIHQQRQLDSPTEVATPMSPLKITCGTASLSIRLVRNGSQSLLLLEEQRSSLDRQGLHALGLTMRETEILDWVAQGKTNPEIGTILGISPRTVQKHLERIYGRLGLENRHAAIRVALDALREPA